ncbi:glycosyltransferase family 39 protein [Luethyella okanaganae]|uniref:Glycosyltransferase family 39 protein n=1 Tax=Luethyella okanaganae TaxID=69372 RepID=A0ABW1VEZ7_9MICO
MFDTMPTPASVQQASSAFVEPSRGNRVFAALLGRSPALPAVALGLLAAVLSALGSWIPSFWGDEAASVMSATRSWDSLWPMLARVDAVHGAYYVVMHLWIDAFGASPFSVRLPSAIAVGFTVAGLVVLAARLANPRVALFAGLVCAVLPRVTFMGSETRGYALSAACAVWLTVLLVGLMRTRETRVLPWAGYAVGLAASVYVFLYLALIVVVHAVILLSVTPRGRVFVDRMLRAWAFAAASGIALAAPVIVLAITERQQIAFLRDRRQMDAELLLVDQWFSTAWLAALCWSVIAAGVGVAAFALWRRSLHGGSKAVRFRALERADAVAPHPLVVGLAWLVLPCALLLLLNALTPSYTIRYLSFAAPAAALIIGWTLDLPRRRWVPWLVIAGIAAGAAPSYLDQRAPFAKDAGSDWAALASTIEAKAQPGDGVIFDESTKPSRRPRLAMHLYPESFGGLVDVALQTPYDSTDRLWDRVYPEADWPALPSMTDRVWLVESGASDFGMSALVQLGYTVHGSIWLNRSTVYELTRGGL